MMEGARRMTSEEPDTDSPVTEPPVRTLGSPSGGDEPARPSATPWSSGSERDVEPSSEDPRPQADRDAKQWAKKKRVRKVTYSSHVTIAEPSDHDATSEGEEDDDDDMGRSFDRRPSEEGSMQSPALPTVAAGALPSTQSANLRAASYLGVKTGGAPRKKATKALLMTKAENPPSSVVEHPVVAATHAVAPLPFPASPGPPLHPAGVVAIPPAVVPAASTAAVAVAAAAAPPTTVPPLKAATQKMKRAQRHAPGSRRPSSAAGDTPAPPPANIPRDVPILDKPGATRVVCIACCAESYELDRAREVLEYSFPVHSATTSIISQEQEAQVVHWTIPTRDWNADADVFVFEYGVVAYWGPNELELWNGLLRCLLPAAVNYCFKEHNVEYLTWSYNKPSTGAAGATSASESDFRTTSEQQLYSTRYSWLQQDHFYLATTEPDIKLAYSHAAAQSEKLSHYEDKIDEQIELTRRYPEELAQAGEVALSAKDIAKTKGQLFIHRMNIILHTDLLDTPDYFWDRTDLEPLYHHARKYFEISRRVRVLNERLDVVAELFDMLHDQQKQKHSDRLEWIVIWLIAVEIIVSILTIYIKVEESHVQ